MAYFSPKQILSAQTFKKGTIATIQAIAQRNDLHIEFAGDTLKIMDHHITLPLIPHPCNEANIALIRGSADSVALRLRYHNPKLHITLRPSEKIARQIFDTMEQIRCELCATTMTGIAHNLQAALEQYYQRLRIDHITDYDHTWLPEIIRLFVRQKVSGFSPPPIAQAMVDQWQSWIAERVSHEYDWRHLISLAEDQVAYGHAIHHVLTLLGFEIDCPTVVDPHDETHHSQESQERHESHSPHTPEQYPRDEFKPSAQESQSSSDPQNDTDHGPYQEDQDGFVSLKDQLGKTQPIPMAFPSGHVDKEERHGTYRVFTKDFDEEVDASALCSPEELTHLRILLDTQLRPLQGMILKLANRLQRRLLAKQKRFWEFDRQEGILDCARLARIVTTPMTPLSFKVEHESLFRDTIITVLIDNSGSMHGRPISIAALSVDILTRTLERCGVKVEILGFTTRAWKGGQARQRWLAENKPPNPGRLNDLRHILYKHADVSWRHMRKNLGLMLHPDLLKENIDGEALQWAHRRLMNRPEQRRLLLIISDGAPVDDSTLSANSGPYLEQHLRQVIDEIEKRSSVELIAIGIGHDVTRYYRRAVSLFDIDQLASIIIGQLAELFEEKEGKYRRSKSTHPRSK